MPTPALTMSVTVWGWLLAACITVLVGCSILAVDAHNILNTYQAMRSQDLQAIRQEIVNSSLSQSSQTRMLVNSSNEQLKQYIDVQIPIKVRDATGYISPINVIQTASPAVTVSPNTTTTIK